MTEVLWESPEEILPILKQRIAERLELLVKVRSEFVEGSWKKQMDAHYFKALDMKSNFIKTLERKKLINKNLVKELKKQALLNKKLSLSVLLVDTLADRPE